MTRTVIVAHGHPKFNFGGGEIAAFRHFEHMREQACDVFFVGNVSFDKADHYFSWGKKLASISPRDFAYRTVSMNPYFLDFQNIADEDWLVGTLSAFDADVYHFHHLWNVGIRTISRLMQAKPQAKFILTLHEYLMICANHGQMVKAGSNQLCQQADPFDCVGCLSSHRPVSFFLRHQRLLRLMKRFDLLIAPSQFLRGRYEAWGDLSGRIKVIENGMPDFSISNVGEIATAPALAHKTQRFAFFGQLTPTKGVNVLVKAAHELARRNDRRVRIDIFGMTAEDFSATFPNIDAPSEILQFMGRYAPQDVISKMRRYGWVVVPSTWWENSPLVIQEAKFAMTPVIASNIGGMKEKVANWGLLFDVGDHYALADVIQNVAGDLKQYNRLRERISDPTTVDTYHRFWLHWVQSVDRHPGAAGLIARTAETSGAL